jgi:hypothetical protein
VLIDGGSFPWHRDSPKPRKDREIINGPRVYRWAYKSKVGEIEAVYIGQSEAFHSRIAGYRTPTKTNPNDTDVIVSNEFAKCEKEEGSVELQFLEFAPFEINGQRIENSLGSLGNHEIRLLLECIALVTARSEKPKLLNRLSRNVWEKQLFQLVQKSSPRRQQEMLGLLKTKFEKDS